MAAIPTIVHIGNAELNGTHPNYVDTSIGTLGNPVLAYLPLWTARYGSARLMQYVPSTVSGGLPASPDYRPWFEPLLGISGTFAVYHHMQDQSQAGTAGSCTTADVPRFGSDITYMQRFKTYYAASPFFKAFKVAYPGRVTSEWKVGGASYNQFLTQWNRAVLKAAPDTMDVKLIIIDVSGEQSTGAGTGGDIYHWASSAASYATDLTDLINQLRTTVFSASSAKVILITHHPAYLQTQSPGAAINVNQIHRALVGALSNVGMVSMDDQELGPTSDILGETHPGFNQHFYIAQSYINQGEKIFSAFQSMTAGTSSLNAGGIPFYIHFGDSQAVGNISPVLVALLNDASLIGVSPSFTLEDEFIYNCNSLQIEKWQPLTNSNTGGTITTNNGVLLTLFQQLAIKHPNGFVIVHFAVSGAAVASTANTWTGQFGGRFRPGVSENYEAMATLIESAIADAVSQTSPVDIRKVPDFRGAFIQLGDNDTYTLADANQFYQYAVELINTLRQDFQSRTDDQLLPVVWVRPRRESALGHASGRITVHAAVTSLEDDIERVKYVNIDDTELNSGDNVHYSSDAALEIGRRMVDKLNEIDEELCDEE